MPSTKDRELITSGSKLTSSSLDVLSKRNWRTPLIWLSKPSKDCTSISLEIASILRMILSCSLLCTSEPSKPASSIALVISSLLITFGSYSTSANDVANETTALLTPRSSLKIPSTEFAHAAHVMPPILN
uniref:Uncharacterized protein n=1 Tax=Opuntia streptacantha TaxID=393608 RepID=A0A7C8Z8Z8_OPUST